MRNYEKKTLNFHDRQSDDKGIQIVQQNKNLTVLHTHATTEGLQFL